MQTQFNIGTHYFHDEPNMNYTAQRIFNVNGGDLQEIKTATSRIKTLEDWKKAFLVLAAKARTEKRLRQAAAYYRAANFYITPGDPDKLFSYDAFVGLMHEIHQDLFTNGIIEEIKVPYEQSFMAAWHIKPIVMPAQRNLVVMHLGFDSLKEEVIPIIDFFREAGLELYLFEGPGQGETLWKYDIPMTHTYEKPVKAVLDFFDLDNVTLIGLSLGGYLAPRAAAFETRIKRVIAWGVMYDFFETVLSRRGKARELLLKALLTLKARALLNAIAARMIARDTYARWGIEHGSHVFGAKDAYEYFQCLRHHTTKDISHLIKQDFLLLSSTHDHFIPCGHFAKQAELLVNVKSFTGRIFTRQEQAENHVAFGNTPLVVGEIIDWIKRYSTPITTTK